MSPVTFGFRPLDGSVPVVFSPWYDPESPPRIIEGVIYALNLKHLKEALDRDGVSLRVEVEWV